jgi:secreted trypsin-like serine protease
MKFTTPLLLSAALLTPSCATDESSEEIVQGGLGETAQGIFNGDPPNAPEHDAVVSLHTRYSNGSVAAAIFCSGTLITSTVVLTAAHCLDTAKGGSTFKTRSPSTVAIYVGNQPSSGTGAVYGVSETIIHPSYNRNALRNDIALIRLASPVAGVTPVPHLPASLGFTSADAGSPINFAGFGLTETNSSGTKLQVTIPLGGLGCSVAGCTNAGDSATQISYAQSGGVGGPCSGDSGGPAFITRGGQVYVGATTSYGDSGCTVYGVSNRADAFEGWIDAFIDGGSSGSSSSSSTSAAGGGQTCGDGTCGSDESCDGRNGTVSCIADCPGKLGGKPSGRYCYVGGVCEGPGCP